MRSKPKSLLAIAKAVLPLGLPQAKLKAFSAALAAGNPLDRPFRRQRRDLTKGCGWLGSFRGCLDILLSHHFFGYDLIWCDRDNSRLFVADPSEYFTRHVAIHLETDKVDEHGHSALA